MTEADLEGMSESELIAAICYMRRANELMLKASAETGNDRDSLARQARFWRDAAYQLLERRPEVETASELELAQALN
jgi:hypothetical protein